MLAESDSRRCSLAGGNMQIGRSPPLSSDKTTHFRLLQENTGVPYDRMLFFDDCGWSDNCAVVERGVRNFVAAPMTRDDHGVPLLSTLMIDDHGFPLLSWPVLGAVPRRGDAENAEWADAEGVAPRPRQVRRCAQVTAKPPEPRPEPPLHKED